MRIERTIRAPGLPTRGACEAAAALGISLDTLTEPPSNGGPETIELDLGPGTVTLIEGASGTGKTTLLRDVIRAARDQSWVVIEPRAGRLARGATVDLVGGRTDHAMRVLARAGLGEASVFIRRAHELSEGQRARLRLALAMERARRTARHGRTVLFALDEFASGLDRVTAGAIARLLARFASETETRVVVATPRDDLSDALDPRERILFDPVGRLRVERIWGRLYGASGGPAIRIVEGLIDDYHALAPLHYRAGPPATADLILAARDTRADHLAGVLVVSHPTLNAAWRNAAWPDRFSSGRRKHDAVRLNAEIRCISRVVVDPRYRSLGIARAMVRAYLARPLTPCTEAIAAMGAACPFFAAAGMREIETHPCRRDARLLNTLSRARLEPWRLAMPKAAWARVQRCDAKEEVEHALHVWANASRATRKLTSGPIEALFTKACTTVASERIAYVWDQEEVSPQRAQNGTEQRGSS